MHRRVGRVLPEGSVTERDEVRGCSWHLSFAARIASAPSQASYDLEASLGSRSGGLSGARVGDAQASRRPHGGPSCCCPARAWLVQAECTAGPGARPGGMAAGQRHRQRPQRLHGAEYPFRQARLPAAGGQLRAEPGEQGHQHRDGRSRYPGRRPQGTEGPRRQAPAGQATSAAHPAAPQIMCGTGRLFPGCSGFAATSRPATAAAISISLPGRAGRPQRQPGHEIQTPPPRTSASSPTGRQRPAPRAR